MSLLTSSLVVITAAIFCYRRTLRYLQIFQQDAYLPQRYIQWLVCNRAFDRRTSGGLLGAAALSLLGAPAVATDAIVAGIFVVITLKEGDPRKDAKLRLVMTQRANRILAAAAVTTLLLGTALLMMLWSGPSMLYLACLAVVQLLPATILLGNVLLAPGEGRRQAKYAAEAKTLIRKADPYIIGITGSYGKTSTKDALGQLLSVSLGATFWPPKGVNTLMGITRCIRDTLNRRMEYGVIEMAAYSRGSIAKLCKFTPPQAGIITSIGKAHLERFGSVEAILSAKAELAEAIPKDGILVCCGDDPGTRRIAEENQKATTLLYGWEDDCDCRLEGYRVVDDKRGTGTAFRILWKGTGYEVFSPLLGRHAVSNLAAAFTMACILGADPAFVVAAIANISPVDNRLTVSRCSGVTYLHDAYNSNPTGFTEALHVLKQMKGKRRILVTPGMVELGEDREKEHRAIGRLAAEVCDDVMIVGDTNRDVLLNSLREGGLSADHSYTFATRDLALAAIKKRARQGDVILIENDLPDLYETPMRL